MNLGIPQSHDQAFYSAEGDPYHLLVNESHNPLLTVFREMGDGVLVLEDRAQIRWMNEPLVAMLDLRRVADTLIGAPLVETTFFIKGFYQQVIQVFASGEACTEQLKLSAPGRRSKMFLTYFFPLFEEASEKEGVAGCIVVFRDITAIKTTEKMRRDFVANVSHELRTPLSVLKGYAETLLGGALEDPAVAKDFVDVIYSHANRLSSLVDDLLDLSRLESPDFNLELEPTELKPVLDRVKKMIQDTAIAKDIHLELHVSEDLAEVWAHGSSLDQILFNLMDNAIKYTPSGGTVTVSALNEVDEVQVNISDTGIGIDPKHIPRLFERFYRVDKARSREMGGTGLGLSIVKHIVHLHGGAIWVESVPYQGSTFKFTLKKVDSHERPTVDNPEDPH